MIIIFFFSQFNRQICLYEEIKKVYKGKRFESGIIKACLNKLLNEKSIVIN